MSDLQRSLFISCFKFYSIFYAKSGASHIHVTEFKVTPSNQYPKDWSQMLHFYIWQFCLVHYILFQLRSHVSHINLGQSMARLQPHWNLICPEYKQPLSALWLSAWTMSNMKYNAPGSSRIILNNFTPYLAVSWDSSLYFCSLTGEWN